MIVNGKRVRVPDFPHHQYMISQMAGFFRRPDPIHALFMDKRILQTAMRVGKRHGIVVPRTLLVDPTSRCNLSCTGCWAGGYRQGDELSYGLLDRIVTESEALGIKYMFFSGGEPLMRKADVLRLCRTHRATSFAAYTNGTLVDEAFADEVAKVGNLNLFLSIEGSRETTDARRGAGVYDKVLHAMDLLRERGVAFGFSACYHAGNWEEVSGAPFLDLMREKGCWFGWLFTYVPVGADADLSMVCTPEQRMAVMAGTSHYAKRHRMPLIDFWNAGHVTGGCIGGGRGFAHINARGDVEPCAFSHWSDRNIHEVSLVEALRSPLFRAYQANQPFDGNPTRSCPLLDHPEAIAKMVKGTGARSTELAAPEDADAFEQKMLPVAAAWAAEAGRARRLLPVAGRYNVGLFRLLLQTRRWVSGVRRR